MQLMTKHFAGIFSYYARSALIGGRLVGMCYLSRELF